jgi:hypothetical protein
MSIAWNAKAVSNALRRHPLRRRSRMNGAAEAAALC